MASAPSIPGATRSAAGLDRAVRAVRDAGLELSGYCRGGMFTADAAHRIEARDDNRRAVDATAALGAPCIVLVVGGLPQYSRPGSAASKDIVAARTQVHDAIAEMMEYAKAAEHAACDRAVASGLCRRSRLREATSRRWIFATSSIRSAPARSRRARRLSHLVGSGIDAADRARRKDRLLAFHVCDWLVPTQGHPQRPRHDGRRRHRHHICAIAVEAQALPAIPRSKSSPTTGGQGRWTRSCRPVSRGIARVI